MSIDWLTFKSSLGCADNISVGYIDEEGTEIPIDSECEFQEAIRLAKMNEKNHLHLILNVDKPYTHDFVVVNENKIKKMNSVSSVKGIEKKKLKSGSSNLKSKENICHCKNGIPLEWFTHYMKKFKKELLHELKISMNESINNALKSERRILEIKSEINDASCDDVFSPVNKQKKKKKCDKELGNTLFEQRDPKLLKKNSHLHPSKLGKLFESKLEKLETKTRSEDKLDVFEKKYKTVLEKGVANKKSKKTCAIIIRNEVIRVRPGTGFLVDVFVDNNGQVPWTAPQLIVNASNEISIGNPIVSLRKVKPGMRLFTFLNMKAGEKTGLFKFVCTVNDGLEVLGEPAVVWVEVSSEPSPFASQTTSTESKEIKCEEKLIDFDQEVIAKSQKKIEENIVEIEKRLQDINLLRSSGVEVKSPDQRATVFKQNVKSFECFGEKEKEISSGSAQKQANSDFCHFSDTYVLTAQDNLCESSKGEDCSNDLEKISDPEVSELYISDAEEDDDNFIVIPSWDDEDKSSPQEKETGKENSTEITKTTETKVTPEKTTSVVVVDDLIQLKNPEEVKPDKVEEQVITDENPLHQPSSSRSRRSLFGDYSMEFKSKKMKSNKSSEYQFTAENLTQPTFSKYSACGFGEGGSSNFTFTAESSKKKEECFKRKATPANNSKGKVIYAVKVNGCCLPVNSLPQEDKTSSESKHHDEHQNEKTQQDGDRQNERAFTEGPSVNILPHVFMNGATNMASLALHTAKSVLNNLQSAFVTEGKTEMGKPACEQKKPNHVSMEAMFKLFEMGFKDLQANRKLLENYENDLNKVIEELVNQQNSRQQQQQQQQQQQ